MIIALNNYSTPLLHTEICYISNIIIRGSLCIDLLQLIFAIKLFHSYKNYFMILIILFSLS